MQLRTTTGLSLALSLSLLLMPAAPAAGQAKTPFKSQVDGLISALNATMVRSGAQKGALGDGSCLMTAQILCAMGHCHRGYTTGDGPVTRLPIHFIFSCRRGEGSFSGSKRNEDPVLTTQWVIDALSVMDATKYEEEITRARDWLTQQGRRPSAFDHLKPITDQEQLKGLVMATSRGLVRKQGGGVDLQASVDALLALVKLQGLQNPKKAKASPFSKAQQKAFDYLLTQQEKGVFFVKVKMGDGPDAKFMKMPDTGLTGIGLAALQTKPQGLRTKQEQAIIDMGLQYLLKQQNTEEGPKKGSFGDRVVNYTTCSAVMAMSKAGRPEFKKALALAQRYILAIQNVENRDYARGDKDYGSIGYGNDLRGDLSNTQFAVEALRSTGLDRNHESFVKTLVFLQRTQNLRSVNDYKSETEKGKTVPDNDGGAAYYPGNSPAGYKTLADGSKMPRSYGSMTYALLKTYTLCGLDKNDKRIQAAVKWIERNWDLDVNPGSAPNLPEKAKYQGLYYYYMVLAQALDIAGIDKLNVPTGKTEKTSSGQEVPETREVTWRPLLRQKLESMQAADGSWINQKNDRWWEGMNMVCTVYAMLALEHCR